MAFFAAKQFIYNKNYVFEEVRMTKYVFLCKFQFYFNKIRYLKTISLNFLTSMKVSISLYNIYIAISNISKNNIVMLIAHRLDS